MRTSATSPARRRRSCPSDAAPARRSRSPRSMRGSPRRRPSSTNSCGQYTEQHPDVIGTRRVIEQLEEQRKQEIEALQKALPRPAKSAETAPDRNPVFQQMRVSLVRCGGERRVARAHGSRRYEAQYRQLKSSARLVPQVEAEFAQLNRDYDVQRKTYGDLLARREAATMGVDVQDTGGTQFRVIDPPRVAPQPVPPTRYAARRCSSSSRCGRARRRALSRTRSCRRSTTRARCASRRSVRSSAWCRCSRTRLPCALRRRSACLFAGGVGGLLASFGAVLVFAFLIGRVA